MEVTCARGRRPDERQLRGRPPSVAWSAATVEVALAGNGCRLRQRRRTPRPAVERRVLREHPLLEGLQLGTRFESELLDEDRHAPTCRRECVGLSPAPVERQHQLGVEPLAERVIAHEVRQRSDGLDVLARAASRQSARPSWRRARARRSARGRLGEPVVGEIARAARHAEGQGRVVCAAAPSWSLRRASPAALTKPFEPEGVDGVGVDGEEIPGFPADDNVAAEHAGAVGDLRLQCVLGIAGLLVAPQLVDQPIAGHRVGHGQRQDGHQRLQAAAHDDDVVAFCVAGSDPTEKANFEPAPHAST